MYIDWNLEREKDILRNACSHLKKEQGRTATEGPRRILTAALQCVGTDRVVDLKQRNIKARVL
jgi:hypothetical protein